MRQTHTYDLTHATPSEQNHYENQTKHYQKLADATRHSRGKTFEGDKQVPVRTVWQRNLNSLRRKPTRQDPDVAEILTRLETAVAAVGNKRYMQIRVHPAVYMSLTSILPAEGETRTLRVKGVRARVTWEVTLDHDEIVILNQHSYPIIRTHIPPHGCQLDQQGLALYDWLREQGMKPAKAAKTVKDTLA